MKKKTNGKFKKPTDNDTYIIIEIINDIDYNVLLKLANVNIRMLIFTGSCIQI